MAHPGDLDSGGSHIWECSTLWTLLLVLWDPPSSSLLAPRPVPSLYALVLRMPQAKQVTLAVRLPEDFLSPQLPLD